MQNDFISGSLGNAEARDVVSRVVDKIKTYDKSCVWATRDTHASNYLDTLEGKYLPVEHCIENTSGWQIHSDIAHLIDEEHIINKDKFGSLKLAQTMKQYDDTDTTIELVGLCTDICVVSNALLFKAVLDEARVVVDSTCCAGVTPYKHQCALETLRSCQVEVI